MGDAGVPEMTDIIDSLNNMMQNVLRIDAGNYSQKIKDDSKRFFNKALNFTVEELSVSKINRLVLEEYRKTVWKK